VFDLSDSLQLYEAAYARRYIGMSSNKIIF
jgi:hypothetical protein